MVYLQRHNRTTNGMFRRHAGSERTRHVRTLALGCAGTLFSLPVAVMTSYNIYVLSTPTPTFWPGWETIHMEWAPISIPMQDWMGDRLTLTVIQWDRWINVGFSVAIFVLFGLTHNARKTYASLYGRAKNCIRMSTARHTCVLSYWGAPSPAIATYVSSPLHEMIGKA